MNNMWSKVYPELEIDWSENDYKELIGDCEELLEDNLSKLEHALSKLKID